MDPLLRGLCIATVLLTLGACTSKPVLTPNEQLHLAQPVSDVQVKKAVLVTLKKRGWSVTRNDPGLVQAEIEVRKTFFAAVDIPYSASGYQIRYRDSHELGYHDGKIHRNYNRWVHALDRNILRELKGQQALDDDNDE